MSNIPALQAADADHFTAREIPLDRPDPFWQQRTAAFNDGRQGTVIDGEFTRRWRTEDPAFTVLQRRLLCMKACADRLAVNHIADHTAATARGDNHIYSGAAGNIRRLKLGRHPAGAQAGYAVARERA